MKQPWALLAFLGAACATDAPVAPGGRDASASRDAAPREDGSSAHDDAASGPDASMGVTTRLRNVDVTIIYPLPTSAAQDAWMSAQSAGLGGELLPLAAFDGQVPQLDERAPLPTDHDRWASLRVVAVRFDPCPGQLVPPPAGVRCEANLRLVFQSLMPDGSARDGAFHAFYTLNAGQQEAVLAELRAIRAVREADPPVPLGVHPRLLSEGMDGALARRIAALVRGQAGASNLVRITSFRRLDGFAVVWDFAIRERVGGRWSASTIATTTTTLQRLRTIAGGRWDADVIPELTHADDPTRLFAVPVEEQRQAFTATVRLLNPRVHSSESVECASCHLAPDIAIFARETMSLSVDDEAARFITPYPLEHSEKDVGEAIGFEHVHMISYLGRTLSLATRTVNETAAVLEQLNGG
jgi:hypothetical protein